MARRLERSFMGGGRSGFVPAAPERSSDGAARPRLSYGVPLAARLGEVKRAPLFQAHLEALACLSGAWARY